MERSAAITRGREMELALDRGATCSEGIGVSGYRAGQRRASTRGEIDTER